MTTDQKIIADFAHLHGRLQALWDMSPNEPVGIALQTTLDELEALRDDVYKALGIENGVRL